MVPNRERSGIVLTAGKAGEKNERKALAAHYTPEGMVVEMVRPLVGVLFRDAWAQSEDDTKSIATGSWACASSTPPWAARIS